MRKTFVIAFAVILCGMGLSKRTSAQEKFTQDTFACPIVGFSLGALMPGGNQEGGMKSLYKGPYLSYGLELAYKTKSNWIFDLQPDMIIGNDNLNHRKERMSDVFTHDSLGFIIGSNGIDASTLCYNRGLSLKAGVGKIIKLSSKNPNSGLLLRVGGGFFQQQTIFYLSHVHAPQVEGDYAYLYDHQRRGYQLTEGIGYWFMSNNRNYFNFYITFEVTQCWNHSTRDYVIDNYLGLHGPDNNRYFDNIFSLKFSWMFPLKGKTSYDYYYF